MARTRSQADRPEDMQTHRKGEHKGTTSDHPANTEPPTAQQKRVLARRGSVPAHAKYPVSESRKSGLNTCNTHRG